MRSRHKTKADKAWLDAITQLGCIVCWQEFQVYTPAMPHHLEGVTKPGCHKLTIPLCDGHHQNGGYGVAFHATGRKTWEAKFGTERELLQLTRSILLKVKPEAVPEY